MPGLVWWLSSLVRACARRTSATAGVHFDALVSRDRAQPRGGRRSGCQEPAPSWRSGSPRREDVPLGRARALHRLPRDRARWPWLVENAVCRRLRGRADPLGCCAAIGHVRRIPTRPRTDAGRGGQPPRSPLAAIDQMCVRDAPASRADCRTRSRARDGRGGWAYVPASGSSAPGRQHGQRRMGCPSCRSRYAFPQRGAFAGPDPPGLGPGGLDRAGSEPGGLDRGGPSIRFRPAATGWLLPLER